MSSISFIPFLLVIFQFSNLEVESLQSKEVLGEVSVAAIAQVAMEVRFSL